MLPPFVAAHGYDAYYLNALAEMASMACSDDPHLA
jgi:5-deoxy-D-glucuronate isomerase